MKLLLAGVALATTVLASCPVNAQSKAARTRLVDEGRNLFFNETFGGNGRTCGTCHPATNNFTIDPPFIANLLATNPFDPLFVHRFNPALAALEVDTALVQNAQICESQDGFGQVCNLRGVPHTLGLTQSITPDGDDDGGQTFEDGSQPVNALGWSADGSPNDGSMRQFAVGAVIQHFPRTLARRSCTLEEFDPNLCDFRLPTDRELDALEAFQLSIGRQTKEADLTTLTFLDPAAQAGALLFQGLGNNNLGVPVNRACTGCHENAGANVTGDDGEVLNDNFDTGVRNVAQIQASPDGGFGAFQVEGIVGLGNGTFNTPSLVEAADTPPFFHNNFALTLEEAITFYTGPIFGASPSGQFGGAFNFDAVDVANVAAFLRALNALENVRSADVNASKAIVRLRDAPDVALQHLQRAASEVQDGIEVLQQSNLAGAAVVQLFAARDSLAAASVASDNGSRNRAIRDARKALQAVPDLIVVKAQKVARQ